jgi:hypothetical protein
MDKIAQRLKAYIDTHPFDPDDSDYETVLDQLYQAYAESHENDPQEIRDGFKELDKFLEGLLTMLFGTSAADFVVLMNIKPSSTASDWPGRHLKNPHTFIAYSLNRHQLPLRSAIARHLRPLARF